MQLVIPNAVRTAKLLEIKLRDVSYAAYAEVTYKIFKFEFCNFSIFPSLCNLHLIIKILYLLLLRLMTKMDIALKYLKILRSFKFMLDEWISLFL